MSSSNNALGGVLNVSINESSTYSPRLAFDNRVSSELNRRSGSLQELALGRAQ